MNGLNSHPQRTRTSLACLIQFGWRTHSILRALATKKTNTFLERQQNSQTLVIVTGDLNGNYLYVLWCEYKNQQQKRTIGVVITNKMTVFLVGYRFLSIYLINNIADDSIWSFMFLNCCCCWFCCENGNVLYLCI